MKKKEIKRENKPNVREAHQNDTELYDLGLEPPKIYREGQRVRSDTQKKISDSKKQKKNRANQNSPTKAERREKENKKRKKRNKFRKAFIWLGAVLAVIVVGVVLSLTVFFHINNITVKGETQYSKEEIIAQCTIDNGENLFMADDEKAKRNIEEKLPYIYNAEIKRKVPDTIEIVVTQATPQYSIRSKDKTYTLLDDNFKVLETGSQTSAGISIKKADVKSIVPGKTIEFKNDKTAECLKKLAEVVKENDFNEITAIYSKSVADNCVVYDGRITFKLGNCDDLADKIFKGLTACEQLNNSNPNAKGTMNITSGKEIYFTEE